MAKNTTGEDVSTLLNKDDGQIKSTPRDEQISQAGGDIKKNKRKVEIAKKDLERRTLRAKKKRMFVKGPNGVGMVKKKRIPQRGAASKISARRAMVPRRVR